MLEAIPSIYVLSDSVGETAEVVIKAGISQFTNGDYNVTRISYVADKETIDETFQSVQKEGALVAYTLVDPTLREHIKNESLRLGIETIDIMGPVLDVMERKFKFKPRLEPGLNYKLDSDYFNRIEAIEFAVKYDDGRDPRGVTRADIVLIGVSRTSKTPLSQFLAHQRYKVANVPLVPEVDPPEELFQIDKHKCVGLKISRKKLNSVRKERLKALGLGDEATYAALHRIDEELDYFNKIIDRIGCQVIDVSDKAVEETANQILQIMNSDKRKL